MRFYKLEDQVIISDKELTCGEELIANTTDGAMEKHVPLVSANGSTVRVQVGSVEHPMLEEHHIGWILLETEAGFQIHYLKPGQAPVAEFEINEAAVAAYEYCNLHGLWKAEI